MPFIFSNCIEEPQILFGRQELLKSVSTLLMNRFSIFIWGERRVGKSSLLHCLRKLLKKSCTDLMPVYIDISARPSIKGTEQVYRFIIMKIIQEFFDTFDDDAIQVNSMEFQRDSLDTIDNEIEGLIPDGKSIGCFEKLVNTFASSNRRIVLLIDEYEYLFETAFSDQSGFMPIRGLSSRADSNISFVIAGTIHWKVMKREITSPALNTTATIIIGHLDLTSFVEMLKYEESALSESDLQKLHLLDISKSDLFKIAGGNPFCIKMLLANYLWMNIDKDNLKNVVQDFFGDRLKNIFRNFSFPNISVFVKSLSQDGCDHMEMRDLGILDYNEDEVYYPFGTYWESYLYKMYNAFDEDFELSNTQTIPSENMIIDNLSLELEKTIGKINMNESYQRHTDIFICGRDDYKEFQKIRKICETEDDLEGFASALYRIFYERTKGNHRFPDGKEKIVSLKTFPKSFSDQYQYNPMYLFIHDISALRQHFGGHKTGLDTWKQHPKQLTKVGLLQEYLGRKTDPRDCDWKIMQRKFLEKSCEFLMLLSQWQDDQYN